MGKTKGLQKAFKKASDTILTPNLKKHCQLLNFFRLYIFRDMGV